ncbi:MAG: hypothetical protein ACYC7L_03895 [Nitrospirota bacterium]
MNKISIKAVIVGTVVDNTMTFFIMNLLAAALLSTGITEDEFMARMKSTNGMLLGLILGPGCTVLGAYVAGRIAQRAERLQGALVAIAGMIVSLIFHDSGTPILFDIAGFALMLPAGIFGGRLAQQRRETRTDAHGQD